MAALPMTTLHYHGADYGGTAMAALCYDGTLL